MNRFFFRLVLFEGFACERYDAFLMCWIQFCLFCKKVGIRYVFVSAFQVLSWSFQRNLIFNFDEAFRRPGNNDQGPRAEAACVVCARKFWKRDLKQLVLFSDPDDEDLTTPNDTVAKSSQGRMCDLLGVERYGERWKHIVSTDAGKAELHSSAVSHPFLPEKKLLLHKAAWVGNPTTPQAVCASCKQALMATPLLMPRYSLANDLWIGRCPPALQNLEAGTQKLLPLVRTCIQVTILQGSGLHASERQRGLIGNSIFLPQASPSQVQRVLPPSAETLQEHFSFVLVDAEKKNIDRAPLLETSHARYAAAVKCLNELSPYYQDVGVAVERLGDDGLAPALLDCVLETSADSALAQRLLQSGPADAQGQDLEEEREDAAPVAHATEEGAKNE